MIENINSGEDYANELLKSLKETSGDLPEALFNYWSEEIAELAINNYNQYIIGRLDTYLISEQDVTDAFDRAGMRYTQDILNGLIDKDMIQAGISKDGEILYSLTEKGKKYPI